MAGSTSTFAHITEKHQLIPDGTAEFRLTTSAPVSRKRNPVTHAQSAIGDLTHGRSTLIGFFTTFDVVSAGTGSLASQRVNGGPCRSRTYDQEIKSLLLYQLSATALVSWGGRCGTRTHDGRDHNPGLYQLSYAHHRSLAVRPGVPGRTRTCDPRLRRPPMLYPPELRARLQNSAPSRPRRTGARIIRKWLTQRQFTRQPST